MGFGVSIEIIEDVKTRLLEIGKHKVTTKLEGNFQVGLMVRWSLFVLHDCIEKNVITKRLGIFLQKFLVTFFFYTHFV